MYLSRKSLNSWKIKQTSWNGHKCLIYPEILWVLCYSTNRHVICFALFFHESFIFWGILQNQYFIINRCTEKSTDQKIYMKHFLCFTSIFYQLIMKKHVIFTNRPRKKKSRICQSEMGKARILSIGSVVEKNWEISQSFAKINREFRYPFAEKIANFVNLTIKIFRSSLIGRSKNHGLS